jgi:pilus assembly protein CpaC
VKAPTSFILMSLMICAHSAAPAQATHNLAQAAQASSQDSANELFVAIGKSVLIDVAKPIQRIAVGLGDIAEATAVSPE